MKTFLMTWVLIGMSWASLFAVTADSLQIEPAVRISQERLRLFPAGDLADAIQQVPGLRVYKHPGPGQYAQVTANGYIEQTVTVLFNGFPLSNAWTGQAELGAIPLERVATLDYYTDANPWGIESAGGVLNIVPDKTMASQPFSRVFWRTDFKQHSFNDMNASFSQHLTPKIDVLAGYHQLSNQQDTASTYFQRKNFRGAITWHISDSLSLEYQAIQSHFTTQSPFLRDTTSLSPSYRHVKLHWHMLKARHITGPLHTALQLSYQPIKMSLENRVFQDRTSLKGHQLSMHARQQLSRFYWGAQYQQNAVNDTSGHALKNKRTQAYAGLSWPLPFNILFSPEVGYASPGVWNLHGRFQMKPGPRWQITVSLDDYYQPTALMHEFGFIPHLSMPMTDQDITLLNYSSHLTPNQDLNPKHIQAIQTRMNYRYNDRCFASLHYVRKNLDDLLQPVSSSEGFQFKNRGQATLDAVTMHAFVSLKYGFFFDAANHYVSISEDETAYCPDFWGTHCLGWKRQFFQNDLAVSIHLIQRYWSEFYTLQGLTPDEAEYQAVTPSMAFDIKILLNIIKNVTLFWEIENFTGQDIGWIGEYALPKQNSRLGIKWDLLN